MWSRIQRAFGTRLETVESHDASSELLRNAHVILSDSNDRTFAVRHYVTADKKRIGFLHLRQDVTRPPFLFEAYLAPPGRFSSFDVIASTDIGKIYGIDLPDRVNAYLVPSRAFAGSCSQAACSMVLVNLVPFGSVCLGAFDITRIAWQSDGRKTEATFGTGGLTATQMRDVLASPYSGVNGYYERAAANDSDERICDTLAGYVRSGCPVIVCVDALAWIDELGAEIGSPAQEYLRRQAEERAEERRHAVVILGCTAEENAGPLKFVVHDSFTAPYLKVSGASLIKAGRAWSTENDMRWIAGVPREVRCGVWAATSAIPAEYLNAVRQQTKAEPRFKTRLYARESFVEEFLRGALSFDLQQCEIEEINAVLRAHCEQYIWTVSVQAGGQLIRVFLFDATSSDRTVEIGFVTGPKLVLATRSCRHEWLLK